MAGTLVIILTYNPNNKKRNLEILEEVIQGWRKQNNKSVDILIADNISHEQIRCSLKALQQKYGLKLLFIDQDLREHEAVNFALSFYKEKYKYYVINTCDAILEEEEDLDRLIGDINYHNNTAFVIPTTYHDYEGGKTGNFMGPKFETNIQAIYNKDKPPTQFGVPYWPHAHIIFYKDVFLKLYNYKVTDLTGSGYAQICTATFAVAVGMKGAICHKVTHKHYGQTELLDLGRSDYPYPEWAGISKANFNKDTHKYKPLCWKYFYDMIKGGMLLGLSYGHYLGGACEIYDPNPDAFDEQGFPVRAEELYAYIKEHFFLKTKHFDYAKVQYQLL